MKIVNCKKCGALFSKNLRNICNSCLERENAIVRTIDSFMDKNTEMFVTFETIGMGTGLSVDELLEIYKAGRIGRYDTKLLIKCAACSAETKHSNRKGMFCTKCAQQMMTGDGIRKPVNDPDKIQVDLKKFDKDIYHTKKAFSGDDRIKYGFKRSYDE